MCESQLDDQEARVKEAEPDKKKVCRLNHDVEPADF